MRLSEWLSAGRAFDLGAIQLDRYGFQGDVRDMAAVIDWLRGHPLLDFPVEEGPLRTVADRPDQAKFREQVFSVWGRQCALSQCAEEAVLEAAHRGGRGAWRSSNDGRDGIPLRVDLHRLMDADLLSIGENGRVTCTVEGYEWADGLTVQWPWKKREG